MPPAGQSPGNQIEDHPVWNSQEFRFSPLPCFLPSPGQNFTPAHPTRPCPHLAGSRLPDQKPATKCPQWVGLELANALLP